ncbi:hypothetical protein D3C80_1137050 [compost metagenome]
MVLTGFDFADPVPERTGNAMIALGQQRYVVNQLVSTVVLGRDPTGAGLEAHVDVFGHQHHVQFLAPTAQFQQLVDDDVVVEVFRQ